MRSEELTKGTARRASGGFTLIEIIVILAVISILVAFLTPSVLKYVADAQSARAQNDINTVQAVVNDLIKDTGQYPGSLADANFLCGPGNIAAMASGISGWATARTGVASTSCTLTANAASGVYTDSLSNNLVANDPNETGGAGGAGDYRTTGNFKWKGPYGQNVNTDPWGNAYEINVSTLVGGNTSQTWIISAGPNGVIDTNATDNKLGGDDIGLRIK